MACAWMAPQTGCDSPAPGPANTISEGDRLLDLSSPSYPRSSHGRNRRRERREEARGACRSSADPCPTSPGCTCSATARGRVLYVGKAKSVRKRVASHFSKAQVPSSPGHAEMIAAVAHIECVVVAIRGRGAARRAELHQAVPAALQHPPARRQVLPVHRDLARRGLPARVLHPRAPPRQPRLLRPLLQRQTRAGHARGAGEGVHVPLVHRPRAGPAQRQPVPRLLHQALRGPVRGLRHARGVPREHRRGDRLPLRALRERSSASSSSAMLEAAARGALRAGHARAQPPAGRALAARAPARGGRLAEHLRRGRRGRRRARRQRPGLPGPRRDPQRPPVLLPGERHRARAGRGRRGVHAPVLRRRGRDPGAARAAARSSPGARRCARRSPAAADGPLEMRVAERGEKRRILELAQRNAELALDQERLRAERRRQTRVEALEGLQQALGLDAPPIRIECFDISNLGGTHTVASMVVFEGAAPKKSDYRRFTIRTRGGLLRRLRGDGRGALAALRAVAEPAGDLAPRPDLRRELRGAAQPGRDRRRQGPAGRRAGGRWGAFASRACA